MVDSGAGHVRARVKAGDEVNADQVVVLGLMAAVAVGLVVGWLVVRGDLNA